MHKTKDKTYSSRANGWLVVGIIFFIVLLFGWLTFADLAGDTAVSTYDDFAADSEAGVPVE